MSKFKVGDIVKIKESYDNKYLEKIAKITGYKLTSCSWSMGYTLNIDGNESIWEEYMLEPYKLTLEDFQFGDIITLRNGERYVYANNHIFGEDEVNDLDGYLLIMAYNELLEYSEDDIKEKSYDIVKVERQGQIIYEREEAVEMTLSEVCEKLGYNVKIVKEKSEE